MRPNGVAEFLEFPINALCPKRRPEGNWDPWTLNSPHPEYSALNTWIPGGTITNFLWSYGGQFQATEMNTFLSTNAPNGAWQQICLEIVGTRKSASGAIVDNVVKATGCKPLWYPGAGISLLPSGTNEFLPGFAVTSTSPNGNIGIIGHLSPWTSTGPTVNLLVYFPADHDLPELEFLTLALAASQRTDTATAVVCVVAPGQLARAIAPEGMIFADDAKGWESLLRIRSRPTAHLLGPSGQSLWTREGRPDSGELTDALKTHLQPGGVYLPRTLELSLRVGMLAPNFIFSYPSGQETTLRKLSGSPVLLIFWRSDASVSLEAVSSHFASCPSPGYEGPTVLAIDDGEDSGFAHGLEVLHSYSAVVVPDPQRLISSVYGISIWPTAIEVDAAGIITEIRVGLDAKKQGTHQYA